MDVFIYIYTFKFMFIFNLEHTEIQFGGIHVGYSPSGLRVSQFARRSMRLKEVIFAGTTDMTLRNYYKFLQKLQISLLAKKYCIFTHNCRHISLRLLQELKCDEGTGSFKLKRLS